MSATVKAIWVHWSCFLRAELGFAPPVSAQMKADSACPARRRASNCPDPARAGLGGERRLRGPTTRCCAAAAPPPHPARPPLITFIFFFSLLPTEANFYSRLQAFLFSRFFTEGVLCLFFFFFKEFLPSLNPEKPNLNSEHDCTVVWGAQIVLLLTMYFHFQTRRNTLHKKKIYQVLNADYRRKSLPVEYDIFYTSL